MRTLLFDYKEFETPSSEQSLSIIIDHVRWWKNISQFYNKTCPIINSRHFGVTTPEIRNSDITDLPPETLIGKLQCYSLIFQYLHEYVNILLIGNECCIPLTEERDVQDHLIYYKHYLIRFCWSTTA